MPDRRERSMITALTPHPDFDAGLTNVKGSKV